MRAPALLLVLVLASATATSSLATTGETGHCKKNEFVFFSCRLKNSSSVVSICAGTDRSWAQFRFGVLKRPSIVFPQEKSESLSEFEGIYNMHRESSDAEVSFSIGKTDYIIGSATGEAGYSFVGLARSRQGKTTKMTCSRQGIVDELREFARRVEKRVQ